MKLLFVTAHPHVPQIAGGSQSSVHELSLELIKRGHEVNVLSGLYHADMFGYRKRLQMKLLGRKFVCDERAGYPTYRKWFVWNDTGLVLDRVRPDVVVVTAGQPFRIGRAFAQHDVPLAVYLRDVEMHKQGGVPSELSSDTAYIANSRFTADRYREVYGIEAVAIPPTFMAERYRSVREPENVTFINPHAIKGRDIAFDIAERCPDIPFSFIEGWPLDKAEQRINAARAAHAPNVSFKPRTTDMRPVYAKAKILLAPSQWEEAWGRIASEAHFSGIPVVATRQGGLPESVGPGGVLVGRDEPIDVWVAAIRRLWDDPDYYAGMSKAALAYARRPELDKDRQVELFLSVVKSSLPTH